MKSTSVFCAFLSVFFCISLGYGQTKEAGPIIKDFGKVYKIQDSDIKVDTTKEYKVVFDIMKSPEDKTQVNASIETAARFLNMHGQNGVPLNQMHVVLVVHNKASKDIANSKAYYKKYQTQNPNKELIEALLAANVQIIFCGQSSVSRDFPKKDLIPGVQLALSAMTALTDFQDQNYQLIKF